MTGLHDAAAADREPDRARLHVARHCASSCFVLVRYVIAGNRVPGFPFLASMIAIFSGAQLLTLGIIGEYLARMHMRVMDRPAYADPTTRSAARGHSAPPDAGDNPPDAVVV